MILKELFPQKNLHLTGSKNVLNFDGFFDQNITWFLAVWPLRKPFVSVGPFYPLQIGLDLEEVFVGLSTFGANFGEL